jgi:hypothetical protein
VTQPPLELDPAGAWPEAAIDSLRFDEVDGRTTISCTSRHPSLASRHRWVQGGMERGLTAAQHRLDEFLAAPAAAIRGVDERGRE